MKEAKLLVISGVSAGAGKDTVVSMFLERHPDWVWPPSTTTRKARTGETHGTHYFFVSKSKFEQWQKEDKFLETDYHADNWYGTLKEPVQQALSAGKNVILRLDVNGSVQIKKKLPKATTVFIDVEDEAQLEKRIRNRATENEAEINARLELARREEKLKPKFDHIIINPHGRPEKALEKIEEIVNAEA